MKPTRKERRLAAGIEHIVFRLNGEEYRAKYEHDRLRVLSTRRTAYAEWRTLYSKAAEPIREFARRLKARKNLLNEADRV